SLLTTCLSALLPRPCGQTVAGGCIAAHPLLVAAASHGGVRGLSRGRAPFFMGQIFRFWSFSRVDNSGGIRASLAGRYASALFDLARDQRQIESVGNSLDALGQALLDSKDFAELVSSPLVSRDEAGKSFAALAPQLSLDPITSNFLGVLARNGRKSELRKVIRAYRRLAAEH